MHSPTIARSILRWLALCVGVFAFHAHAEFPAYTTLWVGPSGYEEPLRSDPNSACRNRPGIDGIQYVVNPAANGGYSYWCLSGATQIGMSVRRIVPAYCPPNSASSPVGGCSCASGYVEATNQFEAEKIDCAPEPVCQPGKGRVVNITLGWARSALPDANDVAIDYGKPSFFDYNDGVCVGNIASVDACWRSQEPASNGLYRLSCDVTMLMTGDAPSAGDPNAEPLTPVPSCPGFLGEINGKPACVGTASNPLPSAPSPKPNPQPGNPTAGEKPASGEGSGSTGVDRTPEAGSGGNTGGPASAAVRPGWVGTSPGEETGTPCGGPGQPVCSVKVDETGTPTSAAGIFAGAESGVDAQRGIAEGLLGSIADWDIGSWTWTFQLPTGCTVLEMYEGVVVDPCKWQPEIHSLMSLVWILTGICGLFVIYSRAF